jgi:hypothetical protein
MFVNENSWRDDTVHKRYRFKDAALSEASSDFDALKRPIPPHWGLHPTMLTETVKNTYLEQYCDVLHY